MNIVNSHLRVLPQEKINLLIGLMASCFALMASAITAAEPPRPNVLFIAIDDLNDWIGCMGGHPQAKTPNLDRLAASGILFTNAHCSAPQCSPSRTAIFTGRSPHTSGVYANGQHMREVLPDAEIIPKTFSRHGYYSSGSGKLLHYIIDAPSWDRYFPDASTENPFPRTLYPEVRPLSLRVGGPWQYKETDWGPLHVTDDEYGGDYLVAKWVSEQLQQKQTQPFFLCCGIYRPHEPWFVPAKYFEPFPLDSIQLPPGYKADDLEDLPPEGKRRGPNQYFAHIQKEGEWKRGIQGYLAAIHFADAMLGRVLDALEHGPNAGNTIVVLWSDHGWQLGEKEHWSKYTAWRLSTRVPLIVRVPKGVPGLPSGTMPACCDKPVSLLSLSPTLLNLCGLPAEPYHDGPSLVPLLQNPTANWPHVAVTYLGDPGSYGLSSEGWRLIHYANGDEELYDIAQDPHEWRNLAEVPEYQAQRTRLRNLAPTTFVPKGTPRTTASSSSELRWNPVANVDLPSSQPGGDPFEVNFENQNQAPVKLYWVDPQGKTKHYADIQAGKSHSQKTRPGAVWLIKDRQDQALGYFQIENHKSKALIPSVRTKTE